MFTQEDVDTFDTCRLIHEPSHTEMGALEHVDTSAETISWHEVVTTSEEMEYGG